MNWPADDLEQPSEPTTPYPAIFLVEWQFPDGAKDLYLCETCSRSKELGTRFRLPERAVLRLLSEMVLHREQCHQVFD